MNTIDWAFAARHAVWLVGLGVVLAVLSYADWQHHTWQLTRRAVLTSPRFLSPLCAGLALFCVGMALVNGVQWQIVAWSIAGLLLAGQSLWYWRARRHPHV